jgi:alcohol dehydrogenase class IV
LPAHVTAAVGMDALAHNLEAYCAPAHHPFADGIAIEGMRLIKENLAAACANGSDLVARGQMMAASSMGAIAFQKGLGAIHALSHPVGSVFDAHHGLTNAVFMPYVLAYNRPAIEDKLTRAARYLGLPNAGFDGFLAWVIDLRQRIGIPNALGALKVDPNRLDELAEMAAVDPNIYGNPVKAGVAELKQLYRNALDGRIG